MIANKGFSNDTNQAYSENTNESSTFPKWGVRLSFFEEFIRESGGRTALQNMTTNDVCENIVKPITKSTQSSYCELLMASNNTSVGIATIFISHAWKFLFVDVWDALMYHFRDNKNPIIWFDLFSNNQHKAVELDFNWWCNTFKSAIEKFGHTVMILAPWNNPIPLTRGWCLFEIYCTIETGSKFEIALSHANQLQFFEDMSSGGQDAIGKMLATIDAEKSECFKSEDRDRIFDVVRRTVGFPQINSMIFDKLREWVISATKQAVEMESDESKKLGLHFTLGTLYAGQGKYHEADPLLQTCQQKWKESLGENDPIYLNCLHSLANLYRNESKYDAAEALFLECIAGVEAMFGRQSPEYLHLLNDLALLYGNKGEYAKAEPLYKQCLEGEIEVLGQEHSITLRTMNDLGKLYTFAGKYDEAEVLFKKCLDTRREVLGPRHPDTLISLSCYAWLFEKKDRLDLAEPLHKQCLDLRKEVLGDKHPDYLRSLNVLGELYVKQGNYDLAQVLFQECLETRTKVLGAHHATTLIALNNLAILHCRVHRYGIAEAMMVECLEARKKTIGEKHPDYLKTLHNLAVLYLDIDEIDSAYSKCEQCLALRKEVLGHTHADCVMTVELFQRIASRKNII